MKNSEYSVEGLLLDESFQAWVDGINDGDHDYWGNWLKDNPDKKYVVEQAIALHRSLKMKGEKVGSERIESSLLQVKGQFTVGKAKTITMMPSKLLRYVAVISLLILSTFFVYNNSKEASSDIDDGMITYIEKVNPTGQKSTTTLSDGTVVKLNSDSRLKFPKRFSDKVREVYFEGEAFFDVAKDASRPFVIRTNDLQVKVLGTSFNVKSFEEDNMVQVGVVTGRVSVQLMSGEQNQLPEPTILLPEESIVYNRNELKLRKEKFDFNTDLAWKDGIILFKDAGFAEVVQTLERWYGYEFKTKAVEPIETKLTGRYDDKSLKFVLGGICYSMGISYEIDTEKNIVTLIK